LRGHGDARRQYGASLAGRRLRVHEVATMPTLNEIMSARALRVNRDRNPNPPRAVITPAPKLAADNSAFLADRQARLSMRQAIEVVGPNEAAVTVEAHKILTTPEAEFLAKAQHILANLPVSTVKG
jgi:hypothetical protein